MLCACGCGIETNLAPQTLRSRGWVKGQPMRYARGHNGSGKFPYTPVINGKKVCASCGVEKPVRYFPKRGDGSGPRARCTACESEARHVSSYAALLKREYGISIDDYYAMLEAQGRACAICRRPPEHKRLAVDHDHDTGKIRGLLCFDCNKALGAVRDDPVVLSRMLDYVVGRPIEYDSGTEV